MKHTLTWMTWAIAAWSTLTTVASAQHVRGSDVVRIEGHGTLSTHEGLGGGLRGEFVVLPDGAIPNFNDDISLTLGADAILFFDDDDHPGREYDDEGLGIWTAGSVQWNFYLGKEWSVFPELGIWLEFGEDGRGHDDDDIDMDLLLAIGGRYHTGARSAIVLRIANPGILHIGVQF